MEIWGWQWGGVCRALQLSDSGAVPQLAHLPDGRDACSDRLLGCCHVKWVDTRKAPDALWPVSLATKILSFLFHLKAMGLSILDSGLLNFRKWYFVCYMFYNSLQGRIWERASICGSPGQWLPIGLSEVYDQGKSDYQGGWKACMANWRTRQSEGGCIQPWQFVILPSMVSASN